LELAFPAAQALADAESHLVGGLVELLGIKRSTNAEGDALAEEDVVGDGGDTAVVDLGLFFTWLVLL
jgi:hypothetical protein